MAADRNLLFGILAVQMNFISRDALIQAMNAWVLEKQRTLSDILRQQGKLPSDVALLLDSLVNKHLERHENDAQKSLAALSSVEEVKDALGQVPDHEVQGTLQMLGRARAPESSLGQPIRAYAPNQRFKILRPHAKGGLGEVFVAEDLELHRNVALKEIQGRHADDPDSRGRFVLEAEVTGGLEHPNIVPVYGLGTYADGRPFYAMRFIRGDSLKDAIEKYHATKFANTSAKNLAFRDMLKRFVDVCNAIAYAHSRGILHRDLKPGNIMLGKYGETLVVDWGLAKAVGHAEPSRRSNPDDERTLHPTSGSSYLQTQDGAAVGTPVFMSPEQAGGRLDELGAASDVYSLGATLYVLLTGQPPFDGGPFEVLVKVEAGEFKAPKQVRSDVSAALNAVVLKAMARRREDRYPTATALADEIEHFLADEPVLAYGEPFAARAKRWARKHPGMVGGTAATLLVGIAGLILGTLLLNGKNHQLDGANAELRQSNADLDVAQKDAENKRLQAEAARDLARQRYLAALDAYNQIVFGIQDKLEARPGTLELSRELLRTARDGLRKLLSESDSYGNPYATLVLSYLRLGDVLVLLGDSRAAKQEYEHGYDLARKLGWIDAKNPQTQRDLTVVYEKLGGVHLQLSETRDAIDLFERCRDIRERLAGAHPANNQFQRDLINIHGLLGDGYLKANQVSTALDHYEKGRQIAEPIAKKSDDDMKFLGVLSSNYDRLGDVNMRLNRTSVAFEQYQKSLEITERIAKADPKSTAFARNLSISYGRLGDAALRLNRPADSLGFHQKSAKIRELIANSDPSNAQAQEDLRASYEAMSDVSMRLSQSEKAMEYARMALEVAEKFAKADENDSVAGRNLSVEHIRYGTLMLRRRMRDEAMGQFRQALAVAQRLVEIRPTDALARRQLSFAHNWIGNVLLEEGQNAEALKSFEKGLLIREELDRESPNDLQTMRDLGVSYDRIGDVYLELKELRASLDYYTKFNATAERVAAKSPTDGEARRDLCISQSKLGDVLQRMSQYEEAIAHFEKSMAASKESADANPGDARAKFDLSICYDRLGDVNLRSPNRLQQSLDYYQKSLAIRELLSREAPADTEFQRSRIVSYVKLGEVEEARFDYLAALGWYEKGIAMTKNAGTLELFSNEIQVVRDRIRVCRNADKAIVDLDFVLKQPAGEVPGLLDIRLQFFTKKNDCPALVATADAYAKLAVKDDKQTYNAACAWSQACGLAKDDAKLKVEYAGKAMALLRKTPTGKGYFVDSPAKLAAHMTQDKDLDPIRERDDFKKLLAELEKQEPAKKP